MKSVLQDWVMELPLREQGTLLTCVRGCDLAPKNFDGNGQFLETPERRLVAWLRWTFMNPADPREVDVPGAFFQSWPGLIKQSQLGHYPHHWVMHIVHCLEVVGYRHPVKAVRDKALTMYLSFVHGMHLHPEGIDGMFIRLSEDRVASGQIVS